MADDESDKLKPYRDKRTASRTPEPFGGAAPRARLFVVQKHAARRMHYDFRLEWGGVLKSWAVPKGPSLDPADKRLAMMVEDHPVEYADFQGVIPPGNYGAGAVIVWDKGVWIPIEDPEAGLASGKLLFDLKGYKLRGRWTLFRTKGRGGKDNEWLLVKKPDGFAAAGGALPEQSIFTGMTVEELAQGVTAGAEVAAELSRLEAPRRPVDASDVSVMLAESAERPFSRRGWIFELKYDGFRLLAERQGGKARLLYRRGSDATGIFPDIARAVAAMPLQHVVMDGEVVVLDDAGRPSFQALQRRVQLRKQEAERASVERPATLFVFDLLAFEGFDLRGLPLAARKAMLGRLVPRLGPVRYCDHVEVEGEAFYEQVCRMGLEGIIGKRADAPYRAGRHDTWLKLRAEKTSDLVVVGFTPPKGTRPGFGALHLAGYREGELWYAGRVGSGFADAELAALRRRLEAAAAAESPCKGSLPSERGQVWVRPDLVCEVRFLEWTEDGLLRQPVFLRFRDDKPLEDCLLPAATRAASPDPPAPATPEPRARVVPFSNLSKVFWPDEGYTKGDLIEFYRVVSPWLLPFLEDRPVVLDRYPDGIRGKNFFQVDAPSFVPEWLRTEKRYSEDSQKEVNLFLVDDVESLLYLANLGTIPLHVWSSRVGSLSQPDWCILDLDPKEAPFASVVSVARAIKDLCDDIEIPSYAKTSGSTGLHVLLPLGRKLTYEQSRALGELLARVIASEHPDIATLTRSIGARGGRVYIDFGQNGHGRLLVSVYSVRPLPGAPVSTPLHWSEVNEKLDIRSFTIKTLPERLARLKRDPLRPVLKGRPDIGKVLERLTARQKSAKAKD